MAHMILHTWFKVLMDYFVLQNLFQFGGVHCGALATIKFLLTNKVY